MGSWMGTRAIGAMSAILTLCGGLYMIGCATERPVSSPTQKEVRGNSDRAFEKLKQEEREHGKSDASAR